MNTFRGLGALSAAYLKMTMRSKTALFWNLAFPMLFLLVFGYIFGRGEGPRVAIVVPGLLVITVISASFFGVAMQMVTQRESGVFRRYRVTPVSPTVVVTAHAAVALFNLCLSITLQVIGAILLFDMPVKGAWLTFIVMALIGFFAFIPLGLIIGAVAKNMKTAPAISNLLFFPMMFLSGAAVPFFMLPPYIQTAAKFLPATYLVDAFQGVIVRGESLGDLTIPIAVLLVSGVTAFALNSLLFRWESEQPVNKKNLAVALSGLAGVYLIAALLVPAFKMAERPGRSEQASNDAPKHVRVLTGATVLDGLGGRIENARVVISDNKITSVGEEDGGALPENATVDTLTGKFLIPGLFDSHIHIGGSAGGNASMAEYMPDRQVHDLQSYLACGVTSVVSLTDNHRDLSRLREAVEKGEMRAPRMFFAGPSITAPDGHPAARFNQGLPGLAEQLTRQVSTAAEAQEAIEELDGYKVDLIKLVLEGGNAGGKLPKLSKEAFLAAMVASRSAGLRTTVHVDTDESAQFAIQAGANGLQHIPEDLSEETIALMVEKGVTITPTLAVYEGYLNALVSEKLNEVQYAGLVKKEVLASISSPQSWLANLRKNPFAVKSFENRLANAIAATKRAIDGGVKIVAGSDAGNAATFHGPGLIRELELLVSKAGMHPEEALISATSLAAVSLGKDNLGRLASNALADVVVLDGDPTKDVRAYHRISGVYLNGKPLDLKKLHETSPGAWFPGQ